MDEKSVETLARADWESNPNRRCRWSEATFEEREDYRIVARNVLARAEAQAQR